MAETTEACAHDDEGLVLSQIQCYNNMLVVEICSACGAVRLVAHVLDTSEYCTALDASAEEKAPRTKAVASAWIRGDDDG